jgi:3-deoxy-manno-octulosonate cytidylyltransferase (CMP-KDO synthetase)
MNGTILAVIPARYASTRFPGKPLALIKNKPLIQWVWEGTSQSKRISKVIVATDDDRIAAKAKEFGAEVCLTSPDHPTGTDRIAEVAAQYPEFNRIINVQGDEPLIEGEMLDDFISQWIDEPMATMARPFKAKEDVLLPSNVKVVIDAKGRALYFSRSPIPFTRDGEFVPENYYQHTGLYAYTQEALKKFVSLPQGKLEQLEKLEQLRAMENEIPIKVVISNYKNIGVDIPEDIQLVEQYL